MDRRTCEAARPRASLVLLESRRLGWAASGRNGGFCDASITRGEENGRSRWASEHDALEWMGRENLDGIRRPCRSTAWPSTWRRWESCRSRWSLTRSSDRFHCYDKGCHVETLSDEVIDAVTEHFPKKVSPLSIVLLYRLGGAFSRVREDARCACRCLYYLSPEPDTMTVMPVEPTA